MSELSVCYASDNNYAMLAGVSMLSLFENNKHLNDISVYFLSTEISIQNESLLRQIANDYSRKIIFISIKETVENAIKENKLPYLRKHILDEYSRFFIAEFLPKNIGRCLYLDCDTLVTSTLDELNSIDISNFICAAVVDKMSSRYKKWIGLKKENPYFNSGILLINLDSWRKQNVLSSLLLNGKLLRLSRKGWFSDQDIINSVLVDKIKTLNLRYNAIAHIEVFSTFALKFLSSGNFYGKEEINVALQKPAIIHYCTNLLGRPWHSNCKLKSAKIWKHYFQKTKWASFYKIKERKIAMQFKISGCLYKIPLIGVLLSVFYEICLEILKVNLYKLGVIKR